MQRLRVEGISTPIGRLAFPAERLRAARVLKVRGGAGWYESAWKGLDGNTARRWRRVAARRGEVSECMFYYLMRVKCGPVGVGAK